MGSVVTPRMARKVNPRSLENLIHEGRPFAFDEDKKRRSLTVTDTGWDGAQKVAAAVGCSGISELLEYLGRGRWVLVASNQNEQESSESVTPAASETLSDEQLRKVPDLAAKVAQWIAEGMARDGFLGEAEKE